MAEFPPDLSRGRSPIVPLADITEGGGPHAPTHEKDGGDEVTLENLKTDRSLGSDVYGPDGSGGVGARQGTFSETFPFTDGDLVAGVLSLTLSGAVTPVHATVIDENRETILPDEITIAADGLSIDIDLTSYGTLTGTWRAVVTGDGYILPLLGAPA